MEIILFRVGRKGDFWLLGVDLNWGAATASKEEAAALMKPR